MPETRGTFIPMSAKRVAVLMYHHVAAQGGSLTVGVKQFESQISGLVRSGYRSLSAAEFATFMDGGPLPHDKCVLITFDDGYLDNWVYAHPVLQRHGMQAVLFVITGLLGDGPVRPCEGQGMPLPPCPTHQEAKALMFGDTPDQVMLRWSEAEAMRQAGTFEFHSHTHTHRRWDIECKEAKQKNQKMREDLLQSRQTLEPRLGAASSHLCWPQGYFDEDYVQVANETGFRYLYTTDARGQNMAGGNPGHIDRFAVRNRPYSWLRQRLWLATHPLFGPWYNAWKARSDVRKQRRKVEVA